MTKTIKIAAVSLALLATLGACSQGMTRAEFRAELDRNSAKENWRQEIDPRVWCRWEGPKEVC